ncbi:MAG: hypothetical protein QOJ60_923 [Actinomycetota bacterium]|nr:hypothetical protein [Actinomycetota bacterium]
MGSGVIYAGIIVLWAVYFIPRWLRRHEELSETRSVEKFSDAMRILSHRQATPDQRYVVMPARPVEPKPAKRARRKQLRRDRATSIAERRRRVLLLLMLVSVATGVAVPLSPVQWWVPVLLAALTVADLVHLRLQERRRLELERLRDTVRRRTRSRLRRFDSAERIVAARQVIAHQRAAADEARRAADEVAAAEEWAAQARRAEQAAGWEPVPVPLPTYVSKPVVRRGARAVDVTVPGSWAQPVDPAAESGELPAASGAETPFDQTSAFGPSPVGLGQDEIDALDATIERRRAVND